MGALFEIVQFFVCPGGPEYESCPGGYRTVAEHCTEQASMRAQDTQSGKHVQAKRCHHHPGAIDVCADNHQEYPSRRRRQDVEIDAAYADQCGHTQEHDENQALRRGEAARVKCHGLMA